MRHTGPEGQPLPTPTPCRSQHRSLRTALSCAYCSGSRVRTCDLGINRPALCQLSYPGKGREQDSRGLNRVVRFLRLCQTRPLRRGAVAQWLERGTHNPLVVGSIPTRPTMFDQHKDRFSAVHQRNLQPVIRHSSRSQFREATASALHSARTRGSVAKEWERIVSGGLIRSRQVRASQPHPSW